MISATCANSCENAAVKKGNTSGVLPSSVFIIQLNSLFHTPAFHSAPNTVHSSGRPEFKRVNKTFSHLIHAHKIKEFTSLFWLRALAFPQPNQVVYALKLNKLWIFAMLIMVKKNSKYVKFVSKIYFKRPDISHVLFPTWKPCTHATWSVEREIRVTDQAVELGLTTCHIALTKKIKNDGQSKETSEQVALNWEYSLCFGHLFSWSSADWTT